MEATPQGLQASAETRQALKRRREELTSTGGNTKARAVPVLKHDVEIPEGFDGESIQLDPSKHGEALTQTSGWSNIKAFRGASVYATGSSLS